MALVRIRRQDSESRTVSSPVVNRRSRGSLIFPFFLSILTVLFKSYHIGTEAFQVTPTHPRQRQHAPASHLCMTKYFDDDIARLQQKARLLLEKSRAKLDSRKIQEELPFFATKVQVRPVSRTSVIKTVNEETGLVTADGEKMAALSEIEQWEWRSLSEVFESEVSDNEDVYSIASKQLADKDVAMQIFNLRKTLQDEDYKRIFDKRNRFIGEDN